MTNQSMGSASAPAIVAEHRGWFTFLGIVLIVAGAAAIAFPLFAGVLVKTFLGWVFLIAGVVQVVQAFSTRTWSEFFLSLLIGILYIVVGAWLAFTLFGGLVSITLLLAALFIVEGIIEIGMGFRVQPKDGWVWLIISGIIAVAAGVLIVLQLPSSADWALGLLAGINMIFSGFSYVFLASAAKV